jgi:hypothetical protein
MGIPADHRLACAWLSTGDMVRGLARAESTPGPLIMVVHFVAYHHPGTLDPWAAGCSLRADHLEHTNGSQELAGPRPVPGAKPPYRVGAADA